MRREDLYQAIGELDEKILHSAEQGWSHSGIFRRALTAAACLILAVGIGSLFFLNRGAGPADPAEPVEPSALLGETDAHEDCRGNHIPGSNSLLVGDVYYESDYLGCISQSEGMTTGITYVDSTVWCYDPAVGESQIIANIPAEFYATQTGYYCTDLNTGEVYRLEGTELTLVGNLHYEEDLDRTFVELLGDNLYYFDLDGFYEMDLKNSSIRLILTWEAGHWQSTFQLLDGMFYFLKTSYGTTEAIPPTSLCALNIETGAVQELNVENWQEDMRYSSESFCYGDSWLFTLRHGDRTTSVYQLNISELRVTELARIEDSDETILDIRQDGETVYWREPRGNEDGNGWYQVMAYDLATGEVTAGNDPFYADHIYPYSGGCYYDEAWNVHGDTYYYDYENGPVCISPPETKTVSVEETQPPNPGQNSDETCWYNREVLQEGETLYYATWNYYPERGEVTDAGLWYYDPEEGESKLLGSFAAGFTQTINGNFCTGPDGTVYRLENGAMERIGTVPRNEYGGNGTLLDVAGDTAYYTPASELGSSVDIWEKPLGDDGSGRQIYTGEPGYTLEQAVYRNGAIYYVTEYQTADPAFWRLDPETGENVRLEFDLPYDRYGGLYTAHICEFYEDCIFLSAGFYNDMSGHLFLLDYETLSAEPLEQDCEGPVYREGDTVFSRSFEWVDQGGYEDSMWMASALELNTRQVTSRPLPLEAGETWVTSGGCYYLECPDGPADTTVHPEIYYYDYETKESVCINADSLAAYEET